jgi:transcriptional regulator with XRE-family HTH domain
LTQAQLGKLAGVSKTTIEGYERGQLPRSTYVARLAAALDVTPHHLLHGEESTELGELIAQVRLLESRVGEAESLAAREAAATRQVIQAVAVVLQQVAAILPGKLDELLSDNGTGVETDDRSSTR